MSEVLFPRLGGGSGQLRRWRVPAAFATMQSLLLGLISPFLICVQSKLEYADPINIINLQSTLDMEELVLEAELHDQRRLEN